MTILTNPDFYLLVRGVRFEDNILSKADDWVCLGTFRFCNRINSCDIVDDEVWPEVNNVIAIASKGYVKHYDKPEFFEYEALKDYEPGHKIFVHAGLHKKRCSPWNGGNSEVKELVPEDFIRKTSGKFSARNFSTRYEKGSKKSYVFCFHDIDEELFEKYKEQIYQDTRIWYTFKDYTPKIRKEFNCIW